MTDGFLGEPVALGELPKGAVFEVAGPGPLGGVLAVKSEYNYPNGGCECVLLASGEYAHFNQEPGDPPHHNATPVREIDLPALLAEVRLLRAVVADMAEEGRGVRLLERYRRALEEIVSVADDPWCAHVAEGALKGN